MGRKATRSNDGREGGTARGERRGVVGSVRGVCGEGGRGWVLFLPSPRSACFLCHTPVLVPSSFVRQARARSSPPVSGAYLGTSVVHQRDPALDSLAWQPARARGSRLMSPRDDPQWRHPPATPPAGPPPVPTRDPADAPRDDPVCATDSHTHSPFPPPPPHSLHPSRVALRRWRPHSLGPRQRRGAAAPPVTGVQLTAELHGRRSACRGVLGRNPPLFPLPPHGGARLTGGWRTLHGGHEGSAGTPRPRARCDATAAVETRIAAQT